MGRIVQQMKFQNMDHKNMNMTDKITMFKAKDNACYLSKKAVLQKPKRLLHVHFANNLLSSIKLPKHP